MATTSTSPIPSKLQTALPSKKTAPRLARIYRTQLKADFLKDIDLFAKHTPINVKRARRIVASLDVRQKWSPAVFLPAYDLGAAIKRVDVTGCYDALAAIEGLTPSTMYSGAAAISSVLSEPWEPPFVGHMRQFVLEDRVGETAIYPILHDELQELHKPIKTALRLIRQYDPEVFEEFENYVTRIKVFNGDVLSGETSNSVFGSIWLRKPNNTGEGAVAYWVEHLVHEVSHLQLAVLSLHDALVLNSRDELFKAPLRTDLRPMFGNFHATFVLARMVRIFRRLARDQKDPIYASNAEKLTGQFNQGLEGVFSERAKLTPVGLRIRKTLQACALES